MKFNLCNIYIAAWCGYYLQGILYEEGGLLSLFFLFFSIAVSLFYLLKMIGIVKKPALLKAIILFLSVLTIYGFVLILSGKVLKVFDSQISSYLYIKSLWISLLPIFPLYMFAVKGDLNLETLKRWMLFFCGLSILLYGKEVLGYRERVLTEGLALDENNMNSGYLFLSLLPGAFLFEKSVAKKYIFVFFCSMMILLSMKRGAMFIGGICVIIFIMKSLKNSSRRNRLWIFITSAIMIGGIIFLFIDKMQTSDYFLMRLQGTLSGDDTSHRDEFYVTLFNHFMNGSPIQMLFGEGANATLGVIGNYAHNDWLELLINQGLLGVSLYVVYWISFYKAVRTEKEAGHTLCFDILQTLLVFLLLKTLFSMSYADNSLYTNCLLALALGYGRRTKRLETIIQTR